jgi:hypothetical protein
MAGDLIISGWDPDGTPLSFNMENGGHGGPGKEETRGFVLIPPDMVSDTDIFRPLDLRNTVITFFNGSL